MPFGPHNGPVTFQLALNIDLSGFRERIFLVFVWHFFIFSKNERQQVDNIDKVLTLH